MPVLVRACASSFPRSARHVYGFLDATLPHPLKLDDVVLDDDDDTEDAVRLAHDPNPMVESSSHGTSTCICFL